MEQSENKSRQSHFDRLDTTAKEITIALTRNQCRHGFIGGYAASLVGGARTTEDVDLIVDEDPANVRQMLLRVPGFQLTRANNLAFMNGDDAVKVEILRGGKTRPMKLPDANSVPLYYISAKTLLGCDGDTTTGGDFEDMTTVLQWLAKNNLRIDFTAYPEKPKEELLPCFRKLYELHAITRSLLEVTMDARDFALICN
ncbi:hypothetical protein N7516_011374 [Penicillium verrucosum]|uniref:uncharacterized protein n=1 Tax=Penicillium verrucosum TaxID=60171 RepID=UPI0025452F11|nr:uncharacterized protein N7516_011374 [Penicillium verrucosum]KAJ5920516.1 hypothetical protein N7516_011374 [Penicillium verrucosum]